MVNRLFSSLFFFTAFDYSTLEVVVSLDEMQTIDKSVAFSQGPLSCCIFMRCLGESGVIFNQSHRKGWWEGRGCGDWWAHHTFPPFLSHPTPPAWFTQYNNLHVLDLLARRCIVCLFVTVRATFKGPLDKRRCHMVRPDVLVSSVHSSSKKQQPVPPLGLCFAALPVRPSADCLGDKDCGMWPFPLKHSQVPACFVSHNKSMTVNKNNYMEK